MSLVSKDHVADLRVRPKGASPDDLRKGSEVVKELADILGIEDVEDIGSDEVKAVAEEYGLETVREVYSEHDHSPKRCVKLFLSDIDGLYDVEITWFDRETVEKIAVYEIDGGDK